MTAHHLGGPIFFILEKGQLFLNQIHWGVSSIFDLTAESAFTDPDLGLRAVEEGVKRIGIIWPNRNL